MPQVTAILPTYGHPELTLSAVTRLREQSAPPAEIIVVDDGAAEPFVPPPGVRLLRHDSNRGFAAALAVLLHVQREEVALQPAAHIGGHWGVYAG